METLVNMSGTICLNFICWWHINDNFWTLQIFTDIHVSLIHLHCICSVFCSIVTVKNMSISKIFFLLLYRQHYEIGISSFIFLSMTFKHQCVLWFTANMTFDKNDVSFLTYPFPINIPINQLTEPITDMVIALTCLCH